MVDIGIYVCGALVVIGGLWLGYLGVFGHLKSQKVVGLCVLFGTLFFVLVGGFLFLLQRIQAQPTSDKDRPFVFFKYAALEGPLAEGKDAAVTFIISNSSQSAEADITIRDATSYFESVDRRGARPSYTTTPPSTFKLAPTAEVNGRIKIPASGLYLTAANIKDIVEGRANLYFFAHGEYQDEAGKKWPVPFCRMYADDFPGKLILCPKNFAIAEPVAK